VSREKLSEDTKIEFEFQYVPKAPTKKSPRRKKSKSRGK